MYVNQLSFDNNVNLNHNILSSVKEINNEYLNDNYNQRTNNEPSITMSSVQYRENQEIIVDNIEHYRNIFSTPDNFIKRRVDYSRMRVADEKYRMEKERLNSLKEFPKHLKHLKKSIAKSGFYYIGNTEEPDKVKCIFCQGVLFRWKKSDIPERDHKKSFPTCPFLLNLNVGNIPIIVRTENLMQEDPDLRGFSGTIRYNVIKPSEEYQMCDDIEYDLDYRENTFSNLYHLIHLAQYGLYITKRTENNLLLRCYKCFKETELLECVEQLRLEIFHSSNCGYYENIKKEILEKENKIHINKEIKKCKEDRSGTYCKVEYSVTDDEIEARMDFGLQNKIDNLKIDGSVMKRLIASNLKNTGKDYESTFDLLKDMRHFVEENESKVVSNSLEFILPDYTCVVCLDKPIEVVFLPCGHFKSCRSCSNLLSSCPVCRKVIERRVWGVKLCHSSLSLHKNVNN